METEGACAVFGPFTLPVPPPKDNQFQFVPWEACRCQCPLCDSEFEVPGDNFLLRAHLSVFHQIVVQDLHLVVSVKGYLDNLRVRFSQQPITDFCILNGCKKPNEPHHHMLPDIEDYKFRKELVKKRLEWVLDNQRKEREDRSFVRGCLFCRYVVNGSRSDYLTHLSYQHNFQLGKADNLVFIDQLIDKVEEKLNKLECIYCEHVFKDRPMLKEHMRKKFHKRINPKNKEYDPFFVVSYTEEGRTRECKEENYEDSWSQWREEGTDWCEWQEEPSPIVCLFCLFTCGEWEEILMHMCKQHNFSYKLLMGSYNFYEQVKIVNYIRREIHFNRCYKCKIKFESREDLLSHMSAFGHFTLPDRESWDHPEFFFSTYENDTFLCSLEDNEVDPLEDLTAQMLIHLSLRAKSEMTNKFST